MYSKPWYEDPTFKPTLRFKLGQWWYRTNIHVFRYASNCGTRIDTYGIGYDRWVLYYHRKGSYAQGTYKGVHGFKWCNYFGTGEGG